MKYNTFLFDLDGVIVNTDNIQYETIKQSVYEILNYDISQNNNINEVFKSTITTVDKLKKLSNYITVDNNTIDIIYTNKKQLADKYFSKLNIDNEKINLMKYLKEQNCKIAIVTNSNKISTNIILKNIGIYDYIDVIVTNEDVLNKKPSPEPYLKAIELLDCSIKETIIFEDSEIGIISAKNTGCDYYHVKSYKDVNINTINMLNNIII
jgi:beta-phosphoglucomutase